MLRQRNGEIRYQVRPIHDWVLLPTGRRLYVIFDVKIEHIGGDASTRIESGPPFPDRFDQGLGESAMPSLGVLKFALSPLRGGEPDKIRSLW